MREIDKLVNRAYPDELRRVTPIAVDEKAILSRALDKLGLEEAKPAGKTASRRRSRYIGRHGAKPNLQLVEMPQEPAGRPWVTWLGWAVAACVAIAAVVNIGPYLLQGTPVAPSAQGEEAAFLKSLREEAGYFSAYTNEEAYAEMETAKSGNSPIQVSIKARNEAAQSLTQGIETASLTGFPATGQGIQVVGITMKPDTALNDNLYSAQYTFAISFPAQSEEEISQYSIDVFTPAPTTLTARENKDGLAYVTFRLSELEDPSLIAGALIVDPMPDLTVDSDGNPSSIVFGFHVLLCPEGETSYAYPFAEEDYIENGYVSGAAYGNDPAADWDGSDATDRYAAKAGLSQWAGSPEQ